jgi:homogentisate 1,2-dioxygenase
VCHLPLKKAENGLLAKDFSNCTPNPNQLRWKPFEIPSKPTDFVEGLITICGAGSPSTKNGLAIHIYTANTPMKDKSFYNSDGDFLIGKDNHVKYGH